MAYEYTSGRTSAMMRVTGQCDGSHTVDKQAESECLPIRLAQAPTAKSGSL